VSPRTAARLAWTLWAASLAVLAGAVALEAANRHAPADANELSLLLVFFCFATVGAVLAARRPDNAVGWICSAIGFTAFLGGFSVSYGAFAAAHPGTLPGAGTVAWPGGTWLWYVTVALTVVFLPMLFPTGHPPSPRWRPVGWAAAVAVAAVCLAAGASPGSLGDGLPANPFPFQAPWAEALIDRVGLPVLGAFVLAAAASLVVRFRRAAGVERQQLKWFTYAAALQAVLTAASAVSPTLDDRIPDLVGNLGYAAIPLAIGVAILRYRLYDIDRIINRTVVYGLVTVILALGYGVGVLVLGQLLGRDRPSLAVARPRWGWPRCSSRPAAASSRRSTGASTGGAMTRPGRSRRSAPACARKSSWTP
jgi:hypothetical protein